MSSGAVLSLIQHHISSGTVCVPTKEHSVSDTVYICTTDSSAHEPSLYNELFTDLVYIHWDQYRYGNEDLNVFEPENIPENIILHEIIYM